MDPIQIMGVVIAALVFVVIILSIRVASLCRRIEYDQEAFQQAVNHYRTRIQAQEQSEQPQPESEPEQR